MRVGWNGGVRKSFPEVTVELKDQLIDCGLKDGGEIESNKGKASHRGTEVVAVLLNYLKYNLGVAGVTGREGNGGK